MFWGYESKPVKRSPLPRRRSQPRRTRPELFPLRIAKKIVKEMSLTPDVIIKPRKLRDGHDRVLNQTPVAWEQTREELYARAQGRCEGCHMDITPEEMEAHHTRGRGAGKRCDCLLCLQALCKDRFIGDGTRTTYGIREGCHTLVHKKGNLREKFSRA